MDRNDARRLVDDVLTEGRRYPQGDDDVVVWRIDEHHRAWIVHVATRRWLKTRHISDQLVGSCPFVIDKATGQLHQYGSAPPDHEKFVAWLDPEPEV
jgi:hypothetical protein